jgi:glycosyltransferase involved in cell wall biosynthesis
MSTNAPYHHPSGAPAALPATPPSDRPSSRPMKIAAVCCTYLRPEALGQMIRCFERQDYAHRELVILDDAGQYDDTRGDRWRLVSTPTRYATLGRKRNAAAALVSAEVEALAVWDDDDWYLPWALSASVAALKAAAWSRPSLVLHPARDGTLRQHRTGGLFHGGWAYRRATFLELGGYAAMNNGEDQEFASRLSRRNVATADPVRLGFPPFYIYRWGGASHLSNLGPRGYESLGALRGEPTAVRPADPPELDLDHPVIVPGIRRRVF